MSRKTNGESIAAAGTSYGEQMVSQQEPRRVGQIGVCGLGDWRLAAGNAWSFHFPRVRGFRPHLVGLAPDLSGQHDKRAEGGEHPSEGVGHSKDVPSNVDGNPETPYERLGVEGLRLRGSH